MVTVPLTRHPQLATRNPRALGEAPPLIFYIGKYSDGSPKHNIADPNTTLESNGDKKGRAVTWSCNDWVIFHKAIVKWGVEGRFKSGVKYTQSQAIETANQAFRQWWDKSAATLTKCGYTSDFYQYFNSVGLSTIFNLAHRTANSAVEKTAKIVDSTTTTAVNLIDNTGRIVDNVGEGIGNIAGAAKYIAPVAIAGVVALVAGYVYKNYIAGNSRVQYGPLKV